MKKKQYLAPSTGSITELELENSILGASEIKFIVEVEPLEEYYYDGTEGTADYLIDF